MSNLSDKKIAFVGSGIIAGVMIDRLLKTGTVSPESILATDVRPARLEEVKQQYGVQVSSDNADAARFGDIIFIAVPPNVVTTALGELRGTLREEQMIISLAAAVPLALMEEVLRGVLAVVRVIPNTPSLLGTGMNPHCLGAKVSPRQIELLDEMLAVFGATIRLDEAQMNIATALTAVGPTYVIPVLKALAETAARHGMPEEQAQMAAAHTVLGAAQLVLDTGRKPDDLKMMIGTRTIKEDSALPVFTDAVELAFAKISESQQKLIAAGQAPGDSLSSG
jgi:pyrroline-5-carboxylate reductase